MNEIHYRILKRLENDPHVSQRALARELCVSLGKLNYCLSALADSGLIRIESVRTDRNRSGYAYRLTARGLARKTKMADQFLRQKLSELEAIKREIGELRSDVATAGSAEPTSTDGGPETRNGSG